MNEELQKTLADIINRVTTGADAAIQFGKEQIPDVLKQLLIWNFAYNFAISVMALLIIIGYAWFMLTKYRWWILNKKTTPTEVDNVYCTVTIIWSILAVIMLFVFFSHSDWLKIWVAPKLYLLEYAADLVKSTK